MEMTIEYERPRTGIVDFNLSIAEEPAPGARVADSPTGFLTELYIGPTIGSQRTYTHTRFQIN